MSDEKNRERDKFSNNTIYENLEYRIRSKVLC